jgi:HK97 family phage major capsid protein
MPSVLENIKKLQEERAVAWEKAKPLVDLLEKENRDFTAEERVNWDAINLELDSKNKRINDLRTVADTEAQVTAFRQQIEGTEDIPGTLATQLRSLFAKNSPINEIKQGFTGREFTRALAVGGATTGGNLVPATFLNDFIQPLRNFSSVLAAGARVITTTSGETMTIPRLSSPGAAAQYAEAATITGTDPAFDQVSWATYKFGEIIYASRELLQDSAVDIESLIGELLGQNIGILLGAQLATGTGSSAVMGLATAATVGITGGTGVAGIATWDNLIDLFYSVTAPYRVNGTWITSDSAISGLRKIKDTVGQYIWQPALTASTPDTILGKAVYTDPNFAAPAVNAKSLVFGDVSKYWVRIVNSLEIMRSDHAAFSSDQIAFRGILRAGGNLTDASAVKAFKGAAT